MANLKQRYIAFWRATVSWRKVFTTIIESTVRILINPSYLMFASVAIVLATMGVWIEFFPSGFSDDKLWYEQLNRLSVFTFCIALLGSMAVEYVFDNKGEDFKFDAEKEIQKHLAFFFWFAALLLSFSSLKSDLGKIFGLSLTILLWVYVNSHRERFDRLNSNAVESLNPRLTSRDKDDLAGDGL